MSNANIDWARRSQDLKPSVRNFIDGRWKDNGGEPLEKYGPRDGKLLVRFGAGEARDVDEAVVSARIAFEDGRWSRLPSQRRKDVLYALVALIEKNREELGLLECLDVGKPINDAVNFDAPTAAAIIKHAAEAVDHLNAKVYSVDRSNLTYQLRRPLGVIAGIVGWNFPLLLAMQKVGPVLATGNSLVLKPSEFTSLSAARIAELAVEAGVPPGVFNVVHGSGAVGVALSTHREVDLVSFTGSSQTGKKLLIASGQSNMKRLILECGGKAPNIVFDDAPNLETVADRILTRAFWNTGQVCVASSRLLIQESIKEELMSIIVSKVAALTPGDPLDPATKFGAVVSREHQQKVLDYIGTGEKEGAKLAYQSSAPPPFSGGFYVPPTIFDRVSPTQKIAQEEIFGPVLSVISFRDEEEAVKIANGTIYGLSAILWTRDLGRAHRVVYGIKAGSITVNATATPKGGPGGGITSTGGHKESGMGVEGGIQGLEAYTSQSTVQMFVE